MQLASCIRHPPLDYSFVSNSKSNRIYPPDHCQALAQTRFFHFYQGGSPLAPAGAEADHDDLGSWAESPSRFEELGISKG